MSDIINNRKMEHINIVNVKDVEPVKEIFQKYRLPYCALPDLDLNEVDTSCEFLGKTISMPFMIGSMTGGPKLASSINKNLAIAAETAGIPVALGSMRVIFKQPETLPSFQVKKYCPNVPLIGNIGLVQLNYGIGIDDIKYLIENTNIDALFFHINHMQEAVQPEGDVNFKGLFNKLEKLISEINIPVMIKEVGAGIDAKTAKRFADIGVKYIDVSGLGGTSWTIVEAFRRKDDLGFAFGEVGIQTDQALIACREMFSKGESGNTSHKKSEADVVKLIAGGGIRNGVDVVKAIMLGADIASVAKPLLKPALSSVDECTSYLEKMKREIQIAMFSMGAKDLSEVKKQKLISC